MFVFARDEDVTFNPSKTITKFLISGVVKYFNFAPGEAVFLAPLDGSVKWLKIPEPGQKEYSLSEHTTMRRGTVFPSVKFPIGEAHLTLTDSGVALQNNDGLTIRGDTLEDMCYNIARSVIELEADGEKILIAILSCWREILGMLFEALGARRSVALMWKLQSSSIPGEPSNAKISITQYGERTAFTILAGIFPGLIQIENIDTMTFEILQRQELTIILSHFLCSLGWLPSPLKRSTDSVKCSRTSLGSYIRRHSNLLVGHQRWLCIEPSDVGSITPEDARDVSVAVAEMRGITVSPKSVILVGSVSPESSSGFCNMNVLIGHGPLVVFVNGMVANPSNYERFQKCLFPYASIILCCGSGLHGSIDTRISHPNRISEYNFWPPFALYYVNGEADVNQYKLRPTIILAPNRFMEYVLNTFGAIPMIQPPANFTKTSSNIVYVSTSMPDAIVPASVSANPEIMHVIEHAENVIVIGTDNWKPAFCNLMHFQKKPFVLRIYS
jgi:hypothetical protein